MASGDDLGPIGGIFVSLVLVGVGWFLTSATNYVLAIGPVETGIGIPIVGWIFVVIGLLALFGSLIEFHETYLKSSSTPGTGRPSGPQGPAPQRAQPQQTRQAQPPQQQQRSQQQPSGEPQETSQQQSTQASRRQPQQTSQQTTSHQRSSQQSQQTPQQQQNRQQNHSQQNRQQDQSGQPTIDCPACEQSVSAGSEYCPNCGASLG